MSRLQIEPRGVDTRLFESIPEPHREAARSALESVFGSSFVSGIEPVRGGASGALTFRVIADGRAFLLRMEIRLDAPFRNPHQYDCMRIASEAGIAPPLHHVDAGSGLAIMDFLPARPLAEFPGGPPALAGSAMHPTSSSARG